MSPGGTCPACAGRGFVVSNLRAVQHAGDCKGAKDGTCEGKAPCSVLELPSRAQCSLCRAVGRLPVFPVRVPE